MPKDIFTKNWIIENSIEVIKQYEPGALTIRGLHYQLVGLGMTNSLKHYKRVVGAMIEARRNSLVDYEVFSDRDREMSSSTDWKAETVDEQIEKAKKAISDWMQYYFKNRWENQEYYPEILIEKKALIGTFQRVCARNRVALGACKGYPSLTFLNDIAQRMILAEEAGKIPLIIYFGDYDPSGEDIPRSIQSNLEKDFGVIVEVRRVALMKEQVIKWNLPPAPTKEYKIGIRQNGKVGFVGDTRDKHWDGLGQVELDAVSPDRINILVQNAIDEIFDSEKYEELQEAEAEERVQYVREIKEFVNNLD